MKKVLACTQHHTVIIGGGITGLMQALYLTLHKEPATVIEKGDFCTGPSALVGQIHIGTEYILDKNTQRWCYFAAVLFHTILPDIFIHGGLTHFGVSSEIARSNPAAIQALKDSTNHLNQLSKELFEELEKALPTVSPKHTSVAKDIIERLKSRILLPSGVTAEPSLIFSHTPYKDEDAIVYKTSQKNMNGLMFLTFLQEFLEQQGVDFRVNTTAQQLKADGVQTDKGFISADRTVVATGLHYPEKTTIFERGMQYMTVPGISSSKDSYFLIPGQYGGMLEYAGSGSDSTVYKGYAPHTKGCQISNKSVETLTSLESADTLVPKQTAETLTAHAKTTTVHIQERYDIGDIESSTFITRFLAQHSQTGISTRPYTPKTPHPVLPATEYLASDKFTYSIYNIFSTEYLKTLLDPSPNYPELLKTLIHLHTIFQPFIEFCQLHNQGHHQKQIKEQAETRTHQIGLPKVVSWNTDYDPENTLPQFSFHGHFKQQLQPRDFSGAIPVSQFKHFGLGLFEIDHIDGEAMQIDGKPYHSKLTETTPGIWVIQTEIATTSTTSWGQWCVFQKTHSFVTDKSMTVSEFSTLLQTQSRKRPLAFTINGQGHLPGFTGQIFVQSQHTSDTGTDANTMIGVPIQQEKVVFSPQKITKFAIGGFINDPAVEPTLTNGFSAVPNVHSHTLFSFDPQDNDTAKRAKLNGTTHTITLKGDTIVMHNLSDFVIPAGSTIAFL